MKVLFFTTAYDPQMQVQVVHQEFLHHLQTLGCEVSILTSQGGSSRGRGFLQEQVNSIPIRRYALRGGLYDEAWNRLSRHLFRYDGFLTIQRRFRSYFRRFSRPDIIHIESAYPLGAVAALAQRSVPIPYVITVRGADLFNEPDARFGYARYRVVRSLLRLAFRRSGAIRATTPQTREIILGYDAPPERVHLVPRNIRDDCFPDDIASFRESARAEILEQHHVSPDSLVLVAAGRMLPIKGFDLLLQALPSVLAVVPRAVLILCGPNRTDPIVGDYAGFLQRLARKLGVHEQVVFSGQVPAGHFTRYLAAADLAVISSIREGSNKVLLEAAALGTPFVATDTSGTGVFFRHPPGGIEVPAGDANALAQAMRALLLDADRRQTLGWNAYQSSARFRSVQVAQQMFDLYRWVLEHPRDGGH
jgi:glycosyltransferase involved in cell wall biosynthesis